MTGQKAPERGLTNTVVNNGVVPFVEVNHVLYCDNFYSSGPLVDFVDRNRIFFVGTIKTMPKVLQLCVTPHQSVAICQK